VIAEFSPHLPERLAKNTKSSVGIHILDNLVRPALNGVASLAGIMMITPNCDIETVGGQTSVPVFILAIIK